MHPPFVFTDHKVGPTPVLSRPPVRRSLPARLNLSPSVGWPPVPLVVPRTPLPQGPSGIPLISGHYLRVVPPPRDTWRDVLGRWLIRVGQRMILSGGPG